MNVFAYSFRGERNRLEKVLEQTGQYSGTLRQSAGTMSVVLDLALENGAQLEANYCYIEELKRYYFVEDVETLYNGFFRLHLYEDVLMSHKEDIKKMRAVIVESENPNTSYMSCELQTNKTLLRSVPLDNPFLENGKLYMLTTQGGN